VKLALLGSLWWHDEHPAAYPDDFTGYTRRRLWVSSANFTQRSMSNLEFGYWTENSELLDGAKRFVLHLITHSEGVNPAAAEPAPDLAPVDFDDDALAEYLADFGTSEHDDELET
jgi:hypothetical protein